MKTLLLVATDPGACTALRELLAGHNIMVHCEDTPVGALSALASFEPDALLFDLSSLGSAGIETVREVRRRSRRTVTIIALSTSAVMLKVAYLYDVFDVYIQKPLSANAILACLE